MIRKKVIDKQRIRKIDGGFAFIPHRFLTDGFVSGLNPDELLLYLFLVLAADRYGLSFYSYDKICTLLEMGLDQYIEARCTLIKQDLIAVDVARRPLEQAALVMVIHIAVTVRIRKGVLQITVAVIRDAVAVAVRLTRIRDAVTVAVRRRRAR